ncbi:zinc metalloprotease [candidate division SR1 bacterium]|nr:zinc metalloprotease [candidate division SR1 bacterium]
MSIILVIVGILMFMLLILSHERGHMQAAKKTGVKVNEFGIGLPPRICKLWTGKDGTEYTLNAIPLGGFCAIKGEDPTNTTDFFAKDGLAMAKLWKKMIIILGGVTMNIIVAWLLFTILFWHGSQPLGVTADETSQSYLVPSISFLQKEGFISGGIKSGVKIQEVLPNSFAESINLQPETIIYAINDIPVMSDTFITTLTSFANQDIVFDLGGDPGFDLRFTCPDPCKLGAVISPNADYKIKDIKFGLKGAMLAGLHEIGSEWSLTFKVFGKLGKNFFSFEKDKMKEATDALAGPVGAIKMGELFYQQGGRIAYLAFAGMISLALAIFNLLPIPALDGGRGIGMILQSTFHIKPEKYAKGESYVNAAFFYLFLLVGVLIILKDLVVYRGLPLPF